MNKDEAIAFLLKVLKSPMSVMSLPTREKALNAAKEHGITATELLEKHIELVWKT